MRSFTDMPSSTSSTTAVHADQSASTSLFRFSAVLRRATLALTLPAALAFGAVVPSAQPVAVEATPAAASVQLAANSVSSSLDLGAPRSNASSGTVRVSSLNLRSGPSTRYRVLRSLSYGTRGTILSRSNGWYKISTSRGTGWVYARYFGSSSSSGGSVSASSSSVVSIARSKIGRPYRFATAGPNVFDCSGFTKYVYGRVGVRLPHNAAMQYNTRGTRIRSYSALRQGDLVFFRNTNKRGISHVGIYAGNGRIIHAGSPRTGVNVGNITSSYYTSRFAGGLRPYR